jgi:hypothetical protein
LTKWGTNPTASSAAAGYTAQQLRALEVRSQEMDRRYGPVAGSLTPQQLAEQLRFQGVDKGYGLIGQKASSGQSSSAPVLASSSDGISWGTASAGAGAVLATAIILLAGFAVMRRREHPVGV